MLAPLARLGAMSIGSAAGQYLVAAAVFTVIDLVWLGFVAKDLYARILGDLLAEEPNKAAAFLFYAIFIAGLVYFAIGPALEEGSWTKAAVAGAVYGLVTYATFDLTNLAVLKDYPLAIVPIDMAWGTVLATSVSLATFHIWRLIT